MADRSRILMFIGERYSDGEVTASMLRDMVKQGYITEEERSIILSRKSDGKVATETGGTKP